MNKREEISQRLLDATHELSEIEIQSAAFKTVFGELTDDEAGRLAREKFEETRKGSEPITLEEADRRMHVLLGKDFGK